MRERGVCIYIVDVSSHNLASIIDPQTSRYIGPWEIDSHKALTIIQKTMLQGVGGLVHSYNLAGIIDPLSQSLHSRWEINDCKATVIIQRPMPDSVCINSHHLASIIDSK
jgi:hypothetical protein